MVELGLEGEHCLLVNVVLLTVSDNVSLEFLGEVRAKGIREPVLDYALEQGAPVQIFHQVNGLARELIKEIGLRRRGREGIKSQAAIERKRERASTTYGVCGGESGKNGKEKGDPWGTAGHLS